MSNVRNGERINRMAPDALKQLALDVGAVIDQFPQLALARLASDLDVTMRQLIWPLRIHGKRRPRPHVDRNSKTRARIRQLQRERAERRKQK